MKKILVVQPLHRKALELLESRKDVTYELVTDLSEENLLRRVASADAIAIRDAPISKTVLARANGLKVISRHGVGFDNIPVDYCSERGIPVAVVGPVNAVAVAEHTMFLLLSAARVCIGLDAAVREGRFAVRGEVRNVELRGRTLLIIGFGRIGREVARRAAAFGMRILAYDPHPAAPPGDDVAFVETLDDGLRQADAVSLHLPLSDEARNILGRRELALLPKGAIVVNASRGGLLDEDALCEAVASGALHGAGLDTFAVEPPPAASPLLAERRIVLSPHSAALTEDTLIAMGIKTVENAIAGLEGRLDPDLVVNSHVLRRELDASQ